MRARPRALPGQPGRPLSTSPTTAASRSAVFSSHSSNGGCEPVKKNGGTPLAQATMQPAPFGDHLGHRDGIFDVGVHLRIEHEPQVAPAPTAPLDETTVELHRS